MVSAEAQKPVCPVCKQSDKVKKLQAVYNEGMSRFAPPPMPGKTVSILRIMVFNMVLVGIFVFLILVLVGSESFGQVHPYIEVTLVVLALAAIILALALSYMAFTRVVRGDQEASQHYSEWDRAMANWNRLRYCTRDGVVFDPQTGKVVPEEALRDMLATEVQSQKQVAQGSTSLAHH
jgi:hypothetical protein